MRVDFPIEKGSIEALRLAEWLRQEIHDVHITMENAGDKQNFHRLQGNISALRRLLARCEITPIDLSQVKPEETEEGLRDETQPIPV